MRAVIFDLDGVITNTQKYHTEIEITLLKHYGIKISREKLLYQYAGVSDEEMFKDIFKKNNIGSVNIDKIVKEKWKLMQKITSKNIKEIPHVKELINLLRKNKFLLAVVSASPKDFIIFVLTSLNMISDFNILISTEEVTNGKPAPDAFLLAAKKLNVKPDFCVVIEDGYNGMLAAKRAGMKSIGFVKDKQKSYPADKTFTSFQEMISQYKNVFRT